MIFRQALPADIPGMQKVRNMVKENQLSDPSHVPDQDVEDYIVRRGRGWVCEESGNVVGFSIVSILDYNVWALFVDPQYEKMGIGKELHRMMIDWYFSQENKPLWLGTAPRTRAELFYRKAGWVENGMHGKGEIKFEMTKEFWKQQTGNPVTTKNA